MVMAIMLLPLATGAKEIKTNSYPVEQGVSYAKKGTDQIYNNLFGTLFTSYVEEYTLTVKNVDTGVSESFTQDYKIDQKVTYPSLFAWVDAGTYEVSSRATLYKDYLGRQGVFQTKTKIVTIK